MRLTRIEIHGFKSFSDRTPLDLPPGLTAVVGPNGCGKSNVIDAVKWALGEQRASALRGNEMLDVIFKGNGARGARNFAEVSLVFDNEDGTLPTEYAEVVITRRLFRSGESEYLINRQTVRLKDVRNLLMDTGLGTGAYSVMEQGRIDAVLSANAMERRRIFEEAAGISRYRTRRRESESKLARTEQNLLRLGDVVEELEKRQRSLKVQAGRARSFLEARDRLAELRSRYYVHQWTALGEDLVAHETTLAEQAAAETKARQALDSARQQVTVLQERIGTTRREADEAAEAFRQATSEVEALSERQSALRDRLTESEGRGEGLQARVAGLERALEQRRRELAEFDERLAAVQQEIETLARDEAAREAEARKAEEDLAQWRRASQDRRERALDRVSKLTACRNERAATASEHAARVASQERLQEQVRELTQRLAEQTSIQGELFAGARDLDLAHEQATRLVEQRAASRQALADDIERLDGDIVDGREELAAASSRRGALDELVARRDGVSPGAIALLESELAGIDGLLVDSLRAPRHLAEAVEMALGATTQAVLVSTRSDGLAALAHLREVQGGRVRLIPRDSLRPREAAADGDRLLDHLEILDHRDVFEALLGHVRVVSDRDELLRCRADGHTVWVTPDGDLLDARGILRGGTAGEESGLVARRAERDALATSCRDLQSRLDDLSQQRMRLDSDLVASDGQLREAEARGAKLAAERERARERERSATERRQALERDLALRQGELDRLEGELTEVAARLAEAQQRERDLEGLVDADQAEDAREEERSEVLGRALNQAQEALSAIRLEVSTRRERKDALESERRQVTRGMEEHGGHLRQATAERQELAALRERLEEETEGLGVRAQTLADERDRRAGVLNDLRDGLATLNGELETSQGAVTQKEGELESASEAVARQRLKSQETRIRRDELRQKVLEELDVDLEEQAKALPAPSGEADPADPAAVPGDEPVAGAGEESAGEGETPEAVVPSVEETDWDAIGAEIEQLRQKLSRMGNVNLAAVDELSEVEERLTFLVGQRDDLVDVRKALNDTISRLNRESRERFVQAFEEVREHFRVIFRKLFRGGRADIALSENEDVLEAGIDITAAPPGKDPRSITLLSGGERTLTAVGLLFALFRAKPSPVCLLDEVDAALDETNIERFCSVLEDFLGQSQFIVVTHARRTMTYADTVYGVTMEEHGVSKVLSLSLEEYDHRNGNGASRSGATPATESTEAQSTEAESAAPAPAVGDRGVVRRPSVAPPASAEAGA